MKARPATALRDFLHLSENKVVVLSRATTAEAGRRNAGSPAQSIHLEPGVLTESDKPETLRSGNSLDRGVAGEGLPVLSGRLGRVLAQGAKFTPESRQRGS